MLFAASVVLRVHRTQGSLCFGAKLYEIFLLRALALLQIESLRMMISTDFQRLIPFFPRVKFAGFKMVSRSHRVSYYRVDILDFI